MPANTSPIFTLTPNCGVNTIAAANTASDGSGSLVTVFTAGSNGSRVEKVRFRNGQATAAASSAMVVRVFVTDTGGSNPTLIGEAAMPAATRTTSVIGATALISFAGGLNIASGQIIKVCQSVYAGAQDLNHVVCEGGDY